MGQVVEHYDIDFGKSNKVFKGSVRDYDATYTLVKKVLNIIGFQLTLKQSNFANFCWNLYFWFSYMNMLLAFLLETVNLLFMVSDGTFFDLFTMAPCIGFVIVALTKALRIQMNRAVFVNLIDELRGMWPNGQIPKDEYQVITLGLKQIKFLIRVYFSCNMILGSIFVIPAVYLYIRRLLGYDVPLATPFSYWLPFDPLEDVVKYGMVLALMVYHCFQSLFSMLAGDLLLIIFLGHVTTQLALLAVRINKLFEVPIVDQLPESYQLGKNNKNLQLLRDQQKTPTLPADKDFEKIIDKELGLIIQTHRSLIRLSNEIENIYTFPLLINFMNSSVIICFCLFCVAFMEKWNECSYKVFFVTAILQTGILCWYGQRLKDTSTAVAEALYNCGWYVASQNIKKSILIMIHRSQKEVHITTYGFSVISLESYAMILKTSWSYFTLLINIYKE